MFLYMARPALLCRGETIPVESGNKPKWMVWRRQHARIAMPSTFGPPMTQRNLTCPSSLLAPRAAAADAGVPNRWWLYTTSVEQKAGRDAPVGNGVSGQGWRRGTQAVCNSTLHARHSRNERIS